jgi:hypothetical protein
MPELSERPADTERPSPFKFNVKKLRVATEYPLYVFEVEVWEPEKGSWTEFIRTEAELHFFIRGVKAAASMFGHYIPDPEIPQDPDRTFFEEDVEGLSMID